MHTQHADELTIRGGICAQSHERIRYRESQQTGQLHQSIRRIAKHHTPTGVDHRLSGSRQKLHSLFDLQAVALNLRGVTANSDRIRIMVRNLDVRIRNVLRDVHNDRAGAAGRRNKEGFLDRFSEFRQVAYQKVMFHAGTCNPNGVTLLECIAANDRCGNLPRQNHQRNGIHIGRRNAGYGIGRTGTRSHQHYAGLPG